MTTYGEREKHIGEWAAVFGDRPRATITATDIRNPARDLGNQRVCRVVSESSPVSLDAHVDGARRKGCAEPRQGRRPSDASPIPSLVRYRSKRSRRSSRSCIRRMTACRRRGSKCSRHWSPTGAAQSVHRGALRPSQPPAGGARQEKGAALAVASCHSRVQGHGL